MRDLRAASASPGSKPGSRATLAKRGYVVIGLIGLVALAFAALPSGANSALPFATKPSSGAGSVQGAPGSATSQGGSASAAASSSAGSTGGSAAGGGGTTTTKTVSSVSAPAPAAPVTSTKVWLQVQSARKSISKNGPGYLAPIPNYKWILNLDNTGDPNQANGDAMCHPSTNLNYPQGCNWPSIRYQVPSPLISEGTQLDWNATSNGFLPVWNAQTGRGLKYNCAPVGQLTPVPCRYLVSVMADGYQIGGANFTVPAPGQGIIKVFLNPFPIPLGTIKMRAFADVAPTNGAFDEATESGLPGFQGLVNDINGVVTADGFGNPLCTQYKTDANGLTIVDANGIPTPLKPAIWVPKDPSHPNNYYNESYPGHCVSDSAGDITIPNMPPNHYSVTVQPPDAVADQWVQTTTLEGNHDHDVWITANDTGLDTERVVGGEPVPFVDFGFAHATAQPGPTVWKCTGQAGTTSGCGVIQGQLYGAIPYVPGLYGLPAGGNVMGGQAGIKLDRPIQRGWVALNSLNASTGDYDVSVATIPTDSAGYFKLTNVPDGEYLVSIWDKPQEYLFDQFNVVVSHGTVVDMGTLPLFGWFAHVSGKVCIDLNHNGRCDPGDPPLFHALVQNLNRTNNAMIGGINTSYTDDHGNYNFMEAYPLGLMSINQFFNTRFKTTGVTWQSCNDPKEHTVPGLYVDVSYLPIIGQCGRLDWAVAPYDSSNADTGNIVATLFYDEIRQKYNARQAQTLDHQGGIPGFAFEQFTPVPAPAGTAPNLIDPLTGYLLNADGSYATHEAASSPLFTYYSETNAPPAQCWPQDANGNPIGYDPNNPNSYDFMVSGGSCIQSSAASLQFGLGTDATTDPNNPQTVGNPLQNIVAHGVQTVDGNYTMGSGVGDTLVKVVGPTDKVLNQVGGQDRPLYAFTTENDVNTFTGAQYVPQNATNDNVTWPPVAAPAKQMPLGPISSPDRAYDENKFTTAPGPDPICTGATFTVNVTNPDFLANGGNPLQGATRHLCDMKLMNVQAGQSVAPNYHVHTVVDVPLPAHFVGYIVDDVSVESSKKSTNLGEVAGIPNVPIGVYDWTGRRMTSVNSDPNGLWEVLMPSADIFNCSQPAGTCPNVYRFVGNDPGQPGAPNLNYNLNYRTIAANFEAWSNIMIPADVAPTRVVPSLEGPNAQFTSVSPCATSNTAPILFAVSPRPYTTGNSETVTIQGINFGARPTVLFKNELTGNTQSFQAVTSTDRSITLNVGRSNLNPGSYTMFVKQQGPAGLTSQAGIGFHVTGTKGSVTYTPHIIEVGQGKTYDPFAKDGQGNLLHPYAIQDALDAAAKAWQAYGVNQVNVHHRSVSSVANDAKEQYLVVVYPHWDTSGVNNQAFVPQGTYYESVVIHSPLKLQGVGSGGIYPDGTVVQGSVIDGRYFNSTILPATDAGGLGGNGQPVAGGEPPEPSLLHWNTLVDGIAASTYGTGFTAGGLPWTGVQGTVGEGAVVTVLATTGTYADNFHAGVNGFTISGGDQNGFPANISELTGLKTTTGGAAEQGVIAVQGGAFYSVGGTDNYALTDNIIRQNNGAYGSIRLGSPMQDATTAGGASHNWHFHLSRNWVVFNGGTNLAGAVAVFSDTQRYVIDDNTFCHNFSAEYGGAITHYGYSPHGQISGNLFNLNGAFDEGGAVMVTTEAAFNIVGGVPVANPGAFTDGTGDLKIDHNYFANNLAQDDGGALRVLGTSGTKSLSTLWVDNNIFNNNVSAHEGGAVSVVDAGVMYFVNNTVAGNVTTATASTSSGAPAAAGFSTGGNSGGLNNLLNTQYKNQVPSWMGGTWSWYSNPLMDNNIFWHNYAGSWTPNGVAGIGTPGDTTALNEWDLGSLDTGALLSPTHSVLEAPYNVPTQVYNFSPTNKVGIDPQLVAPYATKLTVLQMRTYFRFRPSAIISVDLPANGIGDYHIKATSPAVASGQNWTSSGITDDIDGRPRPPGSKPWDIGAHQVSGGV